MSNDFRARAKAFGLLLVLLATVWWSYSYAAHDIWTKEELALLPGIAALEQRPSLSADDLSVLQTCFESRLDRLRIAALRVILLQRRSLGDFWRAHEKSRPLRGTSAQLLPIVDAVFAPGVDPQRALIDVLPKILLAALPKAGSPVPRPIVDGDDPFDQTLLNILIDDAVRSTGAQGTNLLRKFAAYRLTPGQKSRLAEVAK